MKAVYALIFIIFISNNILAQAPANDECSGAILFNTLPQTVTCSAAISANTSGATRSLPNPSCTGVENDDDIWYRFVPGTSTVIIQFGDAINNATGNEAVIGFALYETGCPSGATNLVCNAIGSAGSGYLIINDLDTGVQHYLRFWSTLTGTKTASFEFCVQEVEPAPNDDCSNALAVSTQPPGTNCNSGTHASTLGATRSTPSASCISGFEDDDIWYSFTAVTNAVEIRFSNASQLTGTNNRSNIGYALYEAACPVTEEPFSCANNIGAGSGTELIGGLTPGETYYLRFYSYAQNLYVQFDFCLVDINLSVNDECENAIALTTSSGFCTNPQAGDLEFATTSPGMGAPSCVGLSSSEDVWFKAIIPQTGSLVVQTSAVGRNANNLIMEAYSGTCGNLTLLSCDDDGNPDRGRSALHSRIEFLNRTAGETVFLRVLGFGSINRGKFAICAWDPMDSIAVSEGGNCIETAAIAIDSAHLNLYRWVPFFDNNGDIIAEIFSDGTDLGNTTVSVFTNSGDLRRVETTPYLDRNITVQTERAGTAYVRFYFLNEEFERLRDSALAIQSVDDLQITRTNDECNSIFTTTSAIILPDDAGEYGVNHFIEFRSSGFSSFFINQTGQALPLKFISFSAYSDNKNYALNWTVMSDPNLKQFDIQQSSNGTSFKTISSVNGDSYISKRSDELVYRFTSAPPSSGKIYFRIVMKGLNGESVYSGILSIDNNKTSDVSLYPNPARTTLVIETERNSEIDWQLISPLGQIISRGHKTSDNNIIRLNVANLGKGMYFIKTIDRNTGKAKLSRFLKE